jgi:bacteriocin biosynthesis cyclodehydratase domain-containing protein
MDVDAARRPRFKTSLQPVITADDGLFLIREGGHAWLPDPLYAALARMLDGTHEVEAIFTSLAGRYPAEHILEALDRLKAGGYLAEDAAAEARQTLAFWEHLGVSASLARSRLAATSVSIVPLGAADPAVLEDCLRTSGARIAPEGDVAILVTDDILRPELADWNARALVSRQPWLLVKPVGIETLLGPLFLPGESACWDCLAQRLRGHRSLEERIVRRNSIVGPLGPAAAGIPSILHAALAEAATEIMRFIGTGGQSALRDRIVATNILTLERTQHNLVRRPQCQSCGAARVDRDINCTVAGEPLRLCSRSKLQTSDGGHRACEPGDVLARLERHLSPITGIVRALTPGERTASQDHAACVTPIVVADHSFSGLSDEQFFREGPGRRSGGKGKSLEQARVSALAESLERYCGVFDGSEPRRRASFRALGAAAIHPNHCMGFSDRQYADRESRNAGARNAETRKALFVPEPLREDVEIDWTPLWSLSGEKLRYLPTSYCYFGHQGAGALFARADSNGCAAGSVLEEAVLQGLLELIERDAVALWWYNRLRRPAIDLTTFDDPYIPKLVRHYGGLRRELWALDITSDIGVAAIAAVSRRVDQPEEDIIYGFGAHLDPTVALTRALTELNQALEAVPAANGPESSRTYRAGPEAVHWWRSVKIVDARYLAPDPDVPHRRLPDFKPLASDDLREDVLVCAGLLAQSGIDVFVLDQTRPDINFPVVRVVAPGLRHFWPRFAPGRLYDVPVRKGWLARPLDESELNPFSVEM